MKKTDKSLQKLTDTDVKIISVLNKDLVTLDDIKDFTEDEHVLLNKALNEKIASLSKIEKDKYLKQIEAILTPTTKNQIWECNHNQITAYIADLMQEYGRMPSVTEIAERAQLSRQTVHKHLKEYATHPVYLGQVEQFRFMTAKVLAKVYRYAVNGDVSAAKLYLSFVGNIGNGQQVNNTMIKTQNNYIQINGTVLSQDAVKHLNPEQLSTIEGILKTALPQPEKVG
jgi:DNA-binding phage protein